MNPASSSSWQAVVSPSPWAAAGVCVLELPFNSQGASNQCCTSSASNTSLKRFGARCFQVSSRVAPAPQAAARPTPRPRRPCKGGISDGHGCGSCSPRRLAQRSVTRAPAAAAPRLCCTRPWRRSGVGQRRTHAACLQPSNTCRGCAASGVREVVGRRAAQWHRQSRQRQAADRALLQRPQGLNGGGGGGASGLLCLRSAARLQRAALRSVSTGRRRQRPPHDSRARGRGSRVRRARSCCGQLVCTRVASGCCPSARCGARSRCDCPAGRACAGGSGTDRAVLPPSEHGVAADPRGQHQRWRCQRHQHPTID